MRNSKGRCIRDAGHAGVVGQSLIEGVAEIPAVGQIEASRRNELALRADAFKEHDELELEEDDWVDGRSTAVGVELPDPVSDEAQVERRLQMAIEVISGNEGFQCNGDGLIKAAGLGRAEHED